MTAVLDKIISCPTLPSLPAVAIEVLELTRDPNVSVKEIAKVVENDQAITAKVLRTINSSYYGLASPCPTIQRALGYLGLNTVRSLVLGFSLVDSFKGSDDEDGFNLQAHWRRAIFGATCARTTANRACCTDPDEAFIAAMLQDVGMLAASVALGADYNTAVNEADCDHFGIEAIEQDRFGFTHSEAGALLAERWRLPESLVQSVRFHHKPENVAPEFIDLVQTVALSTVAAESLTVESPRTLVHRFKRLGREWFDLPVDNAEELLGTISQGAGELSRLFQLDTGQAPDVASIMAQAQEQQIATQISMERERQDLETTATEMEHQSLTDGLTGIANRLRFDEELDKAFATAGDSGTLAVLFMDADKFKNVNDTHGHQAGDAVLIELARRVTEAVGDAGLVCRYGGEEFAVIAPGADRIAGARIAEVIRKAIEASPFDLNEVPDCPDELPITISLGVAAVEDSSRDVFTEPAALLKAADTAVYAAKKGGRNCTRVFSAAKAKKSEHKPAAPAARPLDTGVTPDQPAASQTIFRQPPSNQPASSQSSVSPAVAQTSSRGATTVLLIEDDPLCLGLLKSVIAHIDHVDTCAVTSGEQALELMGLDGHECADTGLVPDIMLCDLTLPGISGIDLIKRIRQSPRHASMPLIVINASNEAQDAALSIAAGANAYVPKQRFAQDPGSMIEHIIGFWTTALMAG